MSEGKFCIEEEVVMVALNHLTICSQFLSRTCAATGLKPIMDLAFLLMTEEPPCLENCFPPVGTEPKPPFAPLSLSELASWTRLMGLPPPNSRDISSWFRYIKLNTVKRELSVVPEMGMENLLPSSS